MNLDELKSGATAGAIDTVVLALPDMQGRLQGKRFTAEHFLGAIVDHGAEGCNYLLATDAEMTTLPGFALTGWDRGYGDFLMIPDLGTLRRTPWLEGTAMCLADVSLTSGGEVAVAPRTILRRQLARLEERGWRANVGTELEFLVFRDSYEEAWGKAYRDLVPANLYNVDYSLLGTARVEPLIRRIRNSMLGAEMKVENSKGECNFGQHEINFLYADALATADNHVVYKNGAKEIAAQEGMSISFMAKFDEREGNSCHIHVSLCRDDGSNLFATDRDTFERFIAGQLAALRELALFHAPNVNSYKRFTPGSFAPTSVTWGRDNRTTPFRLVGHGQSLRIENRLPGADVNPYLAIAAMIAAGLHGIDNQLDLEPAYEGNAYESDKPRVPASLGDAHDLFAASAIAREAFGEDVVEHYLNSTRHELEAFAGAVTDWERFRGFERL